MGSIALLMGLFIIKLGGDIGRVIDVQTPPAKNKLE